MTDALFHPGGKIAVTNSFGRHHQAADWSHQTIGKGQPQPDRRHQQHQGNHDEY